MTSYYELWRDWYMKRNNVGEEVFAFLDKDKQMWESLMAFEYGMKVEQDEARWERLTKNED